MRETYFCNKRTELFSFKRIEMTEDKISAPESILQSEEIYYIHCLWSSVFQKFPFFNIRSQSIFSCCEIYRTFYLFTASLVWTFIYISFSCTTLPYSMRLARIRNFEMVFLKMMTYRRWSINYIIHSTVNPFHFLSRDLLSS